MDARGAFTVYVPALGVSDGVDAVIFEDAAGGDSSLVQRDAVERFDGEDLNTGQMHERFLILQRTASMQQKKFSNWPKGTRIKRSWSGCVLVLTL
jgi:hypothetical protein